MAERSLMVDSYVLCRMTGAEAAAVIHLLMTAPSGVKLTGSLVDFGLRWQHKRVGGSAAVIDFFSDEGVADIEAERVRRLQFHEYFLNRANRRRPAVE